MKRDALNLAREILKAGKISVIKFNAALEAILVQADRLKPWRPVVEKAYARLPERVRRMVQSQMLGFYNAIHDWDSAYRFLPARPQTPEDLLFSMETLLNLRKLDAAKSIQRRCLRMLGQSADTAAAAPLLEALASYHAQAGELEAAEEYWKAAATVDGPFARNAMTGLVEIAAVRGLCYLAAGLQQIEEFRKSRIDEEAIILPRNREGMLEQAEQHLKRYQEALVRVVPPDELWHFGVGSD